MASHRARFARVLSGLTAVAVASPLLLAVTSAAPAQATTGTTTSVSTTQSSTPVWHPWLKPGVTNQASAWVKYHLGVTPRGPYYTYSADAAVKAFQKSHGLAVTGMVNETSWDALEARYGRFVPTVLKWGDHGTKVSRLQLALRVWPRTSYYGPATISAVRRLQGALGVTPTGKVNALLWRVVLDRYAARMKALATVLAAERSKIMSVAKSKIGDPYVFGAAGPNAFDCSGYTEYVYAHAVGISLPHNAAWQYSRAKRISWSSAKIGDLVFFHSSSGAVYHVGLYFGNGKVLHSSRPGTPVGVERIWTSSVSFGRILG